MVRVTPNVDFDANEIAPGLYQGSRPWQTGSFLRERGFSCVVLCAEEFQPERTFYTGIDVLHAPNDDNPARRPTRSELQIALAASKQVALRVMDGKNVLVTCMAGLNRSGLVCAFTLHHLYGWSGEECVARVQERRADALFNRGFVQAINKLKARPIVLGTAEELGRLGPRAK